MAKPKSKALSRAEYLIAAGLLTTLRNAPPSAAALPAFLLDKLIPRLRRVARQNLSFAFPELSPQAREHIADGVFQSVGRLVYSMAHFPQLNAANISRLIEYEGLDNYLAAKQEGHGVLVATAHLGNWELSAYAHALLTEPMNVMVRPLDNPHIDAIVERLRTASGNRLIYKRDAARSVIRALKANEAVGILIDQNTTPAEGTFIDFFGRKACAGTAFVKLAYHSGAAVVPGFALWQHSLQRYVLRFYPRVELTGDVHNDTQQIHSLFESIIRQYPDQWMWIHRRWKTQPAC